MADAFALYPSALKGCTKILPEISEIFERFELFEAQPHKSFVKQSIYEMNKTWLDYIMFVSSYDYNPSNNYHDSGNYYAMLNKTYFYSAHALNKKEI